MKISFCREIRENLRRKVSDLKAKLPEFSPGLAIVQVGGREDSNVYIRMKIKAASEIGINATHVKLPNTTTEHELLNILHKLNNDPSVHGIIVQMPLDSVNKINSHLITDTVSPDKDVDGSLLPFFCLLFLFSHFNSTNGCQKFFCRNFLPWLIIFTKSLLAFCRKNSNTFLPDKIFAQLLKILKYWFLHFIDSIPSTKVGLLSGIYRGFCPARPMVA